MKSRRPAVALLPCVRVMKPPEKPSFSIDTLLVACDGFEDSVWMIRRHLGNVAIEIDDRPRRVALNHGVNLLLQIIDLARESISVL